MPLSLGSRSCRLFGLTVPGVPPAKGGRRWGCRVTRQGELRATSSLLLNFCVRLRSKLSKINFHVEKLQIALSNRDGNREMLLLVRARWHPLKWSVFSWVCTGVCVCGFSTQAASPRRALLSINFFNGFLPNWNFMAKLRIERECASETVRVATPTQFTDTDILSINGKWNML